jgi:hypothetical protein
MCPLITNSPSRLISLVVRVYPMDGLDVHYSLLSGETPLQWPAVFSSREQLAIVLRELGLLNEAALVTLSDEKTAFTFRVVSTSELMEVFGFNKPAMVH